jgi:hypothetical protein
MFFWGMPKFFKARPGPLSFMDKTVSLAAPAALFILPLPWLVAHPELLAVYLLSFGTLTASLYRQECRRCIYFDCPANRVPQEARPASGPMET